MPCILWIVNLTWNSSRVALVKGVNGACQVQNDAPPNNDWEWSLARPILAEIKHWMNFGWHLPTLNWRARKRRKSWGSWVKCSSTGRPMVWTRLVCLTSGWMLRYWYSCTYSSEMAGKHMFKHSLMYHNLNLTAHTWRTAYWWPF